ncbi:hypothetical protein [Acinetobacter sp. YH01009]|uniref:hypothetical protein n=1 Tax=Acinetobacter sp. YH01009 TaxID=2601025 RepID=UPI0015D2BD61|nr:hypothetical protein [Acinetobacter sp. YH01009]
MNQIEKLEHLKAIMAKVPCDKLDMDSWRDLNGLNLVSHQQMLDRGASACVMGWATADEIFQKLNFNFVYELPVYVPYKPFGVELLAKGVRTGFEFYQATEAVMEFFGLDEDQADFLISSNSYSGNNPNEAIANINILLKEIDCIPYELNHLYNTSTLSLDLDLREFKLESDDIREITVAIDCENKYFPDGGYLEFIATINIPKDLDPIQYIEDNFNVTSPLSFVPNPNDLLEEYLEKNEIIDFHLGWQEDFVSPYDETFNAKLTHIVMESISNARILSSV